MNPKQVTTPTSALPARPERPAKYAWPVSAPDGSVGYDRPLENYFDATMAPRLLPSKPPARLYDTIARAYDHRFQVTPDMVDPSPRLQILHPRERRRSLAKVSANSTDYMGISPDAPEWRPRRSSYEDRRGAVGVTPSEVNTLIPYIPPIDTSLPPPSKEWLDAKAREFLAGAHADFVDSRHHATSSATKSAPATITDDTDFFDYDTDSTLDGPIFSRTTIQQPLQQTPQAEPESSSHEADFSDTDTDTDTDTDMNSDSEYNWSTARISESNPHALGDIPRWIIPRKRPSVVIANNRDVTVADDPDDASHATSPSSGWDDTASPPPSSDDEHAGKRRRGGKSICLNRDAKKPKRHANDTPARHGRKTIGVHHISESEEDSSSEPPVFVPLPARTSSTPGRMTPLRPPVSAITAAALQMQHVRLASLGAASPGILLPSTASVPPKPSKVFPCLLDGCTQVCASAGDLQRHQQSLRHSRPSHSCLACGKSYTRSDALKRHLNSKASCKRVHATKLAGGSNTPIEDASTEAGEEAVQAIVCRQ